MKRALFVLSFLLFPLPAFAAEEGSAPAPAGDDAHLRGLEVTLRPTVGGGSGTSPITVSGNSADAPAVFRSNVAPYGLAGGTGMQIGYRFHPIFSAGIRGDYQHYSADTPNDGTKDLSRNSESVGLYTRLYPLALSHTLRQKLDPWVGAGVMYVRDAQSFSRQEQKVNATWEIESHAIGIPIGIGFDYRVTDWLSAGPSVEYVIMNPVVGCAKANAPGYPESRVCTDDTSGKSGGLVASSAGTWNAGLTLRVTPF
jgi:hypothetical protein